MPKLSVVETPISTPIAALADDFLADCKARGLSVRTLEWYQYEIRVELLAWCVAEGITDPGQLTPALANKFTTHLLEDGGKRGPLSRATIRSRVRAARVFLGWVEKAEGGASKVGAKPPLPKRQKLLPDVLSREEIHRMEDSVATERDKLIIRVLADAGLRLGELLGSRPDDLLEPKRGEFFIKVHGKGDEFRLVPLAPALYRRLRTLAHRTEGRDPIFLSLRKGPSGQHHPLTSSGAEQVVRLAGKEAGITKRVYPHLLRHSYATNWLKKNGNIISLKNNLGHADLSMITEVYSHLNASDDYAATMQVLSKD